MNRRWLTEANNDRKIVEMFGEVVADMFSDAFKNPKFLEEFSTMMKTMLTQPEWVEYYDEENIPVGELLDLLEEVNKVGRDKLVDELSIDIIENIRKDPTLIAQITSDFLLSLGISAIYRNIKRAAIK